jgi:integrase
VLGLVANGGDPANDLATARARPALGVVLDDFMRLHVAPKLKPATATAYRSIFQLYVSPKWGRRRAEDITKADLAKLHAKLADRKATANRVLNYLSAAYSWAGANGYVSAGYNPTAGIERYGEAARERYLNLEELDRLGAAIRTAETVGIPWVVDETGPKAKHTPKADRRQTPISPEAAAALRLLLFTGARLREILHLQWRHVDFERAALFLPDSKTGKKVIYLNAPALAVLRDLPRTGAYVFPGEPRRKAHASPDGNRKEQPRADLKRPWEGIRRLAGLDGVRLHDLRHTHASFGVGGGLGLPIIAKLLGHSQIRTTERYSHLDADPIRLASESIGKRIAEAMGEGREASRAVSPLRKSRDG